MFIVITLVSRREHSSVNGLRLFFFFLLLLLYYLFFFFFACIFRSSSTSLVFQLLLLTTYVYPLLSIPLVPHLLSPPTGFGSWMLLSRELEDELKPFTEVDEAARRLQDALALLAERTPVLFLPQSR